jgi:hypothetical protein
VSKHPGHQLAGYDRKTDALAVEYDIDAAVFRKIRKIVEVDADDPKAIASYPLSGTQLRAISDVTGIKFDADRYEFFLEPT